MPDHLSLSPADAARLAAGETVRVWVVASLTACEACGSTFSAEHETVDDRCPACGEEGYLGVPGGADLDDPAHLSPTAPAARGDRVKVACPDCDGEPHGFIPTGCNCMCHETDGATNVGTGCKHCNDTHLECESCDGTGRLPALVAADPEPAKWCEECEGEGTIASLAWTPNGVDQLSRKPEEYCSTCHGTPPWGWWLTIQREETP